MPNNALDYVRRNAERMALRQVARAVREIQAEERADQRRQRVALTLVAIIGVLVALFITGFLLQR